MRLTVLNPPRRTRTSALFLLTLALLALSALAVTVPAKAQSESTVPYCSQIGGSWDGGTNTCTVNGQIHPSTSFNVTSGTTLVVGSDGTITLTTGITVEKGATFDIENSYCPGDYVNCLSPTGSIIGVDLLGGSITNYGVINVEDAGLPGFTTAPDAFGIWDQSPAAGVIINYGLINIAMGDGGTSDGIYMGAGTIVNEASGTIVANIPFAAVSGASLAVYGQLYNAGNVTTGSSEEGAGPIPGIANYGTWVNSGEIDLYAQGDVSGAGFLNYGTIINDNGGSIIDTSPEGFINEGFGAITNYGLVDVTLPPSYNSTNYGSITDACAGSVTGLGGVVSLPTCTLILTETPSPSYSLFPVPWGNVGATFDLSGSGYAASAKFEACLAAAVSLPSPDCVASTSFVTDSSGDIPSSISLQIPSTPPGVYEVLMIELSDGAVVNSAPLWVTGISLTPSSGLAESQVVVSGAGFYTSSTSPLTFTFDGASWTPLPSSACDPQSTGGPFICTFDVPNLPLGTYTVVATGVNSHTASAQFTISNTEPTSTSLTCTPQDLAAGQSTSCTATVTGSSAEGEVTFSTSSPGGVFTPASCALPAPGACTVKYQDSNAGTPTLTATFSGTSNVDGSQGSTELTVLQVYTTTSVACSPSSLPYYEVGSTSVTCTAIVADNELGTSVVPTEEVTFVPSISPATEYGCVLQESSPGVATCNAQVFLASGSTLVTAKSSAVTASYLGDNGHLSSSGSTSVEIVQPTFAVSPASGPNGTSSALSGAGFAPESEFYYCLSSSSASVSCVSGGQEGSFFSQSSGVIPSGTTVSVPTSTPAGSYAVIVFTTGSNPVILASAGFTVTTPTLAIAPSSGSAGTLSGSGYAPGVQYDYCLSANDLIGGCFASASSSFTATSGGSIPPGTVLYAPSVPLGAYDAITYSGTTVEASTPFTVTSTISLSPSSGSVGTRVTVTGVGFKASTAVTFTFEGSSVASTPSPCETNGSGAFTCSFVAAGNIGADMVQATDGTNSPVAIFTVTSPSIGATPSSGPFGATVTITGSGLVPGQTYTYCVSLDYLCELSGSFVADSQGGVPAGTTFQAVSGEFCVFFLTGCEGNVIGGTVYTTVSSAQFQVGVFYFTYTYQTVAFEPYGFAAPGTQVQVSAGPGSFVPGVTYGLCLFPVSEVNNPPYIGYCDASQSFVPTSTGAIPAGTTFTVPNVPAGQYYLGITLGTGDNLLPGYIYSDLTSYGQSLSSPGVYLVINPTLALSQGQARPGSTVTLSGSGFAPSSDLWLCIAPEGSATCSTSATPPMVSVDSTGNIPPLEFTVPDLQSGVYAVGLVDGVGNNLVPISSAQLTIVNAVVSVSPASGPAGMQVTLSGTQFAVDSPITISFAGSVVTPSAPCSSNSTGGFSCTFAIPATAVAGPATITATDGSGGSASTTFTVLTPSQATQQLVGYVSDLHLSQGLNSSLVSKLDAALQSISSGNTKAAVNQLNAFVNEVNAQTGKAITVAEATLLTNDADAIAAGLSG